MIVSLLVILLTPCTSAQVHYGPMEHEKFRSCTKEKLQKEYPHDVNFFPGELEINTAHSRAKDNALHYLPEELFQVCVMAATSEGGGGLNPVIPGSVLGAGLVAAVLLAIRRRINQKREEIAYVSVPLD